MSLIRYRNLCRLCLRVSSRRSWLSILGSLSLLTCWISLYLFSLCLLYQFVLPPLLSGFSLPFCRSWLHSRVYTEPDNRVQAITENTFTILEIRLARLIGSFLLLPSASSSWKRMKSTSVLIGCRPDSRWHYVCGQSCRGSSPSGKDIPDIHSSSMSMTRVCWPDSGSVTVIQYRNVIGKTMNQSCIWSEVSAVPEEATTFSIPLWCMEMTSV